MYNPFRPLPPRPLSNLPCEEQLKRNNVQWLKKQLMDYAIKTKNKNIKLLSNNFDLGYIKRCREKQQLFGIVPKMPKKTKSSKNLKVKNRRTARKPKT
jgi:hypothetical protein